MASVEPGRDLVSYLASLLVLYPWDSLLFLVFVPRRRLSGGVGREQATCRKWACYVWSTRRRRNGMGRFLCYGVYAVKEERGYLDIVSALDNWRTME